MTQAFVKKNLLWDWPVRVCHWSIVLLVAACWWTIEIREVVYHTYCAYALLGVVVFRIYWGFVGSQTARFSHFVTSPRKALIYLKSIGKRDSPVAVGHNPIGGYSALVLLLLLLVQIGLGLFSIDVDGFDGGPFMDAFKFRTARMITEWHETGFNVLLGFIALHIAAISYYLIWRKQNLTAAMIHGKAAIAEAIAPVGGWRILVGVILSFAVVWSIL